MTRKNETNIAKEFDMSKMSKDEAMKMFQTLFAASLAEQLPEIAAAAVAAKETSDKEAAETAIATAAVAKVIAAKEAAKKEVEVKEVVTKEVAEEKLNEENIKELIQHNKKAQSNDPEIIGLIGAFSGAALSVGADLLFGDGNKSALDIASNAVIDGVVAGSTAFLAAKFLTPEDNSVLGMTAIGLGAAVGVVATDKLCTRFLSDDNIGEPVTPTEMALARFS